MAQPERNWTYTEDEIVEILNRVCRVYDRVKEVNDPDPEVRPAVFGSCLHMAGQVKTAGLVTPEDVLGIRRQG